MGRDTTEFIIGSSAKLYLAAIMDLHSRFIVGWALSAVNDRHLTLSALDKRSRAAAQTAVYCITRIRAARLRARTIAPDSRSMESHAR